MLLLLGACGYYDAISYEGWWHWAYWQAWDRLDVAHWAAAAWLFTVGARAYYLSVLLYGTIRDPDTGLIYRVWLRMTAPTRTVIYDSLYPIRVTPWGEWELRGTWYEDVHWRCYELPANWYGYHYYVFD